MGSARSSEAKPLNQSNAMVKGSSFIIYILLMAALLLPL
jgi:hypothetical protein